MVGFNNVQTSSIVRLSSASAASGARVYSGKILMQIYKLNKIKTVSLRHKINIHFIVVCNITTMLLFISLRSEHIDLTPLLHAHMKI